MTGPLQIPKTAQHTNEHSPYIIDDGQPGRPGGQGGTRAPPDATLASSRQEGASAACGLFQRFVLWQFPNRKMTVSEGTKQDGIWKVQKTWAWLGSDGQGAERNPVRSTRASRRAELTCQGL